MKTRKVPFDIYIPATEHRTAIKVDTIQIDVYTDDFGNEMVTTESSVLIDRTQARYMGLLAAEDIRALRDRHGLSQDQLSDLLGCGKKSLSRWENGREYPRRHIHDPGRFDGPENPMGNVGSSPPAPKIYLFGILLPIRIFGFPPRHLYLP
jgi:DNA-binding transcriptional regulator YiaG